MQVANVDIGVVVHGPIILVAFVRPAGKGAALDQMVGVVLLDYGRDLVQEVAYGGPVGLARLVDYLPHGYGGRILVSRGHLDDVRQVFVAEAALVPLLRLAAAVAVGGAVEVATAAAAVTQREYQFYVVFLGQMHKIVRAVVEGGRGPRADNGVVGQRGEERLGLLVGEELVVMAAAGLRGIGIPCGIWAWPISAPPSTAPLPESICFSPSCFCSVIV